MGRMEEYMRHIILSLTRKVGIYLVTVVSVAVVAFYAARTKPSDMIQTQVQTQVQTQSQSMNIYTFTLGDAKLDAKNPQLVYTDVVFVSYVWNQKDADDKAAAYLNTVSPLTCRALVKYSAGSSFLRYRIHLLVPRVK